MATSMPIAMTIGALIGVLITSVTTEMYGFVQWNPLIMLRYVQAHHYTAACRASTFFAGCGFFGSQIFVNMTQNCVSSGMDLLGLSPSLSAYVEAGLLSVHRNSNSALEIPQSSHHPSLRHWLFLCICTTNDWHSCRRLLACSSAQVEDSRSLL
jgi:hypothetical protein